MHFIKLREPALIVNIYKNTQLHFKSSKYKATWNTNKTNNVIHVTFNV